MTDTNYAGIMSNKEIIKNFSQLQAEIARKNSAIGESLEGVVLDLLRYKPLLATATREDLFKFMGRKRKVVEYLFRIVRGESIAQIAKEIRTTKSGKLRLKDYLTPTPEEKEGTYENGVRALEDTNY